jgi:hypothetical protein
VRPDTLRRRRTALAAALLATFAGTASLDAQDPVPQDTVRVEIPPEQMLPDTVPPVRGTTTDTLGPPPELPVRTEARPAGFADAVWEWHGPELERLRGATLIELLERVPGLIVTRPHGFGQPAGIAAFGAGGGRLRVFRDGYELDPMGASLLHLQHIGIADLAGVRVTRSIHETRIDLSTFRLTSRVPHSAVEAGTGQPTLKLLRGVFARPTGQASSLLASFDLLDTRGPLTGPPSTLAAGAARWTRSFSPRFGAELEFRQLGTTFGRGTGAQDFGRGDLLGRMRFAPSAGIRLDALAGRSWRRPEVGDSVGIDATVDQAAVLGALRGALGFVDAAARVRRMDGDPYPMPTLDLSLRAGIQPTPLLFAEADARAASGRASASEFGAAVQLGPFAGVRLFGSGRFGARSVGTATDTFRILDGDTLPAIAYSTQRSTLDGYRFGAEWMRGSGTVAAAWLLSTAAGLVPFGLPFDAGAFAPLIPETTAASGFEATAALPIAGGARFEATGTWWAETGARPYLPDLEARAALVFHGLYYTDNLEPTFRIEAVHRGAARVPGIETRRFDTSSDPYTLFNLYLQIRIIDVRAFLIWENLFLERAAADVPGAPIGPRIHYGVRWVFRD